MSPGWRLWQGSSQTNPLFPPLSPELSLLTPSNVLSLCLLSVLSQTLMTTETRNQTVTPSPALEDPPWAASPVSLSSMTSRGHSLHRVPWLPMPMWRHPFHMRPCRHQGGPAALALVPGLGWAVGLVGAALWLSLWVARTLVGGDTWATMA